MNNKSSFHVNNLCYNYKSRHGHGEVIANFYCFKENVYMCDDCTSDHKDHGHLCDSVKNHLGKLFHEWLRLHEFASNITKYQIDNILEKQKNLFKNLRTNSEI